MTADKIKIDLDVILAEVAKTQNIKNGEIKPNTNMDYGDGFISHFFTGEIKNKDTKETIHVAIKKAPFWEFNFNGFFKNELLFYNSALPALDHLQKEAKVSGPFDNVPNYYCGSTTEPKKAYIAMEFLKPHGYILHDRTKFFDQEHLKFIFKTYGKFHALSFVLRKKHLEIYQNITKDLENNSIPLAGLAGSYIKGSVSATIQALDKEKYKDFGHVLKDFEQNSEAIFLKAFDYNGDNRCLVHGDCWSNNMMFKYSDLGKLLDIKLLDFQICRDGSPIHDLSYFFYSGASKQDFDNVELFLQIYYKSFAEYAKELGANPDEIFSFKVLVKEWKENALLGIIFGVWVWQLKLTNKKDFNTLTETAENIDISEEERTKLWEEYMRKVYEMSTYKENTTAILIHAFEYGIIKKDTIFLK